MVYCLIFLSFTVSVFLSLLIIPRILVVAFRKRLFDALNDRKVHTGMVPRLGGLSFLPTLLFSLAFTTALRYMYGYGISHDVLSYVLPEFYLFICGLTLLYLAGIKDDLVGLRYRTKFIIQIISASFLPLSGLWINNLYGLFGIHHLIPWLGIPFTMLVIVFITNAINLIDGIDGLASGLSSVALAILGTLFLQKGMWIYATLAFSMLGMLLPFFYYNVFGKAERCKKIFMGDTGSLTLGYILSFLTIRFCVYNSALTPFTDGAIVISFSTLIVPLFDVVRVMLIRFRLHRGLFTADKNHIHHKFLAMGFTPRGAMLSILMIACLFSCLNILLVPYVDSTLILLADIGVWISLNCWFDKIKYKKSYVEKNLTGSMES